MIDTSVSISLRKEPDPILRAKCEEVVAIDDSVRECIAGMAECMAQHQGIGLAAPQVGIAANFFITRAPDDILRVFINPEIISTSQQNVDMEEGCLSIPQIYGVVSRPRDIIVQAYDENGKPFSLEATGMLARVVLHEYDHLHGVLFWDYLSPVKRKRLQARYQKIR